MPESVTVTRRQAGCEGVLFFLHVFLLLADSFYIIIWFSPAQVLSVFPVYNK